MNMPQNSTSSFARAREQQGAAASVAAGVGADPYTALSPVYVQVLMLKDGLETLDRKVSELIGRVLPALRYDLREAAPSVTDPAEAREVVSPLEDELLSMSQRLMRTNCLLDELTRSVRL